MLKKMPSLLQKPRQILLALNEFTVGDNLFSSKDSKKKDLVLGA